jgi:hypothetical protein
MGPLACLAIEARATNPKMALNPTKATMRE